MAEQKLSFIVELLNHTEAQFKEISDNLDTMQKQTENTRAALEKTAMYSGLAFGAVSLAIGKSVSDFSEFDTAIQKAGANVDASAEQLQVFRDVALKASTDTGVSANDTANALFYLAGGTISASDAAEALQKTVEFAKANQLELRDATLMSAQVMTLFKVKAEDMQGSLDLVTKAGQVSFATADQLAQSFQQAAPEAAQLGISMLDLTSILGAMGDAGYLGSEAGVALKRAMEVIATPTKQSSDALAQLGITSEELQGKLNTPIEVFRLLQDRLAGVTDKVQRASIVSQIFGQGAGPAMSALLGVGVDAIDTYKTSLEDVTGATHDAFERQMAAQNPLKAMAVEFQALSIQIGQAVMPALTKLVAVLGPIIEKVSAFAKEHPKLAAGLLLGTAAVLGLVFAFSTLGLVMLALTPVVAAFGAITLVSFGWTLAIVAGIAAVIYIGYQLYKHWGELSALAMKVWHDIIDVVSDAMLAVYNWISGTMTSIENFFVNTWNSITAALSSAWDYIIEKVVSTMSAVKDFLAATWEALKSIFWVSVDFMIGAWVTLLDFLFPGWAQALQSIFDFAVTIFNSIVSTLSEWVSNSIAVVTGFMDSLMSAWTIGWGAVSDATSSVWNTIVAVVSKWMGYIATVISGFLSSVTSQWNTAWTAVKDTFSTIWEVIKAVAKTAFDYIKSGIDALMAPLNNLIDLANRAMSAAKNAVGGAVNFVGGGVSALVSTGKAITGRASGGSVNPNTPYIVGENGPELFSPATYGTISAGGMGGLTVVVTGNSFMGSEGVADLIGRQIMDVLKQNVKISA